ncbi:hypothetical protein NKDENANG_00246 [Candidatus Entotheonellaceae bacterium PAL068K]
MPPQDDSASLVIGLAQVRETGYWVDVTIRPALLQLPHDEETAVTAPIQIRGWLTKADEQVYFQGQIRGVVTTSCSRCLEVVRLTFEAETRVVFLPPTSEGFEAEGRLGVADDLDLYTHNGMTLDLQPLVREQVVLAFPVQPLCQDDCAGLCQVCGENWNREACTCQAGADDSRFAMLRRLRFPESL